MAVALLADAHLGGPGGDGDPLIQQLEALSPMSCERLVLLGDLFHIWVGDTRYETPEIRRVLPALRGLGKRGVELAYVEGNRDFFIADSPYAELFGEISSEVSFEVDGRRYLAVHGDGLNARDRQYLFWRWLSKNRASRWFSRRLPAILANYMVTSTERRLARTNFKHKVEIPETVIREYGERRLAEGYDAVLLGHFHEPRTWQVGGGVVRILDAWYKTRRMEWIGR